MTKFSSGERLVGKGPSSAPRGRSGLRNPHGGGSGLAGPCKGRAVEAPRPAASDGRRVRPAQPQDPFWTAGQGSVRPLSPGGRP